MALTPAATKVRRVRRLAIKLFRAGTEQRTLSKTGVLLYLSLAERRAEIVADAAIHSKARQEEWGEAMAALVAALRDNRPGDGIVSAVQRIGVVLAAHFPHSGNDPNELPDRLIEL
jgi:putative membrane protein